VSRSSSPLEPVDCEAALDRALRNLAIAIHESGAEIVRGPLPRVMSVQAELAMLLQNLIGNGIKFRKKDQPCILRISAELCGEQWFVSVADNGIGIAPEYFERIFTIFQRLHTRTEYPGTGIGLALSKCIAERHGGSLTVTSEPGHGSTFTFHLRCA
jgi:light-regulated signal transduction histidine kinase (bacteriophytochrome)